ncbi:MAG: 3-phosphoshikimate 1-carboxyvinyltransferase [Candidatus Omnitrophota bacterium]
MKPLKIRPCRKLRGTVILPGDKSISHRAAILAALSPGRTLIRHFQFSEDCLTTLSALKSLGVRIKKNPAKGEVSLVSKGRLASADGILNMGESGTSARVLMGILAGQPFLSELTGAPSLSRRPMARVIAPLRRMGALIRARTKDRQLFLPVRIFPSSLRGISWQQQVASAQVKSAILFAGLFAEGKTRVLESARVSRDHTERMLKFFGANIRFGRGQAEIQGGPLRSPGLMDIPGDISSAAFFIVAALLLPGSRILLKRVGVNPTRMGAVRVLQRMGGQIRLKNKKNGYEPVADLEVLASPLRGCRIPCGEVASLIDELPVLMVAAVLARGKTVIEGIEELRVKETDRIHSMTWNLLRAGGTVSVKRSGKREDIHIQGSGRLQAGHFKSFGDHRTAMSMFVAALTGQKDSVLDDISCARKSFPEFLSVFEHLLVR